MAEVKSQIERIEGTQRHLQRLFLGNRQLDDDEGLDAISAQTMADAACSKTMGNALFEVSLVRVDSEWAATLRDIENGWMDLRDADESMKCNREIVTAAVRCDGVALQHASDKLKSDRGVVLAAVKSNGSALRFASSSLRRDRDIVLAAVRGSALALRYAADELWHDREFTLAAVRVHGSSLVYVPEHLRRDREVVFAAVQNDPSAICHAHSTLHFDPEIKLAIRGVDAESCDSGGGSSRTRRIPGSLARLRCGVPHNRFGQYRSRFKTEDAQESAFPDEDLYA